MDSKDILEHLTNRGDLLQKMEILTARGNLDERGSQKLQEIAGFCAVILRYVEQFLRKNERIEILECACGKSYLGFALQTLLSDILGKSSGLVGVDSNAGLIEQCRELATALELEAEFVACRTVQYQTDRRFDLVVALHACDTATDQAIAKGIELRAPLILTVPCCQNQIRGQIRDGHPLTAMTEFGPVRYRLANMLTDTLRAQFLYSAGYFVEMDEIASPRLTPKNLCICARRVKRRSDKPRDVQYRALRDLFHVRPKIERYCPQVLGEQEDS